MNPSLIKSKYSNLMYLDVIEKASSYEPSNSLSACKIVESVTFDNKKVMTITYEITETEVINKLLGELQRLNNRVIALEKGQTTQVLVAQDTLKEIWNNTKDDIWANI